MCEVWQKEYRRMPPGAVLSLEDAIRLIELKKNATSRWTARALREQGVPDAIKLNEVSRLHNFIRRQGSGAIIYRDEPLTAVKKCELNELYKKYWETTE